MKKLIIIAILLWATPTWPIDVVCRIGHKYPTAHPNHEKGWRDGQIVRMAPNGTITGSRMLVDFVIIRLNDDYDILRENMQEFRKWTLSKDLMGRFKWEVGFTESERKRDWFVDFKKLLNDGYITQSYYDNVYDGRVENKIVIIDKTIEELFSDETKDNRLDNSPTVIRK